MTLLYIILAIAALILLASLGLFMAAFMRTGDNDFTKKTFPADSPYTVHRELLNKGVAYINSREAEDVYITSFDGLSLHGSFYPADSPEAVALLFHGWRSRAVNDFCCAVEFLHSRHISVLLVDERAHGESGGRVISFGVNESRDCADWAKWAAARFPDKKLILEGISMGAATVMTAAALPLPESVCAVIEDCGYTSPEDILACVSGRDHVPPAISLPLLRLGARLFGGFDLRGPTAVEGMRSCRLPCLFIHGEADDFVPCDMGRRNYEACASEWKKLVTVPGAGHGFAYVVGTAAVQAGLEELLSVVL